MNEEQRRRIVDEALACVGVPFALGQASRAGMDCAGLLHYVATQSGLYAPRMPSYTRRDCFGRKVYTAARSGLDEYPVRHPLIGSIGLFWVSRPQVPMHLAIFDGAGAMIHAYPEIGKVCMVSYSGYWEKRIFAMFDFRIDQFPLHGIEERIL